MILTARIKKQINGSLFRELLSGSSIAFAFKAGGSAATFLFTLLIARTFEASDAGLFFLVITLSEIITMITRLGLSQSIIAFVGRYAALNQWPAVKGVFQKSIKYIIIASIIIGLALIISAHKMATIFFSNASMTPHIRIMAFAIMPVALLHVLGNSLKGLGKIRNSQFIIALSPQLFLLIGMLMIMPLHNIAAVLWAYVIAAWITAILGYTMWHRHTPQLAAIRGNFPARLIFATALPLLCTNVLMIINSRVGTLALGILADPSDVLVYNVALRISLLSSFALLAVNAYCAPKFAALHGSGDLSGLGRVARQATLIIIIATLPLMLFILAFPEMVLSIFGPALIGSSTVLITLVIGQCFNIASGPVGMLLAMTGHEKTLRNIYLFSTPLNVALQLVLIPSFQAGGAAWATTLSILIVNISAVYMVHHRLGINIFPSFKPRKTES